MVYEQLLVRASPGSDKGIAFFMRASVSPSDRNLVSAYVDGGFLFTGFSDAASRTTGSASRRPMRGFPTAPARSTATSSSSPARRIRSATYEAILEVTYQHEVRPGFLLQPVLQYIAHPGGGAVDPNDPTQTKRIKDGVMVGVRTTITY